MKRIFGEMMTSYLVVVLVKRDVLENDGVNFEQQVTCPSKEDSVACCLSCMLSEFVCLFSKP